MTHDYLEARFLYVRQDFDDVLEELTDVDLPLSPIDDMPSVARLLVEMANKEKVIRAGPDGYERTELGQRMLEAWL